jgi:hypothetical protein
MVQHLQMWDYVALSGTSEGRYIEYVDQQHEHFVNPTIVENACYMPPRVCSSTIFWKQFFFFLIYRLRATTQP